MNPEIDDQTLDFLLARAGLVVSPADKAELKSVYRGVAAMAERLRRPPGRPRGHMAEPAHCYGFAEDDL